MIRDILWLHQAFKLAVNELDSNVNVGYPPELIDIVLNKAVLEWLKEHSKGLELNQPINERLSSLVIRTPITSTSTIPNDFQGSLPPAVDLADAYEYRLGELKHRYYRFMSAHVEMTKAECSKRARVKLEQHDDIEKVLIDNNRKPSWRYGEVVGVQGRDSKTYTIADSNEVDKSLIIYTEQGCSLGDIYLTYLKVPNQISIGGYNDLNGNPMVRTELDIPQEYYQEIIEFAKTEVANTYGFTNAQSK